MRTFKVNKELYDKAVHREYRLIERFFDIREAYEFKERFTELWVKIQNETVSQEELLNVADLIKKHCE